MPVMNQRIEKGSRGGQKDNYSVRGSEKGSSTIGSRGSRKYWSNN